MKKHFILTNAVITDGSSYLIPNGFLEVKDERIAQIGKMEKMEPTQLEEFDLGGRLVLPGLTNFHHHLYSALAVGLAPKGKTDSFEKILQNLWWHLDKNHNEQSIYYSALQGIIDSVKYGVTTIFDHHASMKYISGSLNTIEKALREIGIKGVLCYEISDRPGLERIPDQIEENLSFWRSHINDKAIKGMLGLHANLTLSDQTMEQLKTLRPKNCPIHIRCGEAKIDLDFCKDKGFAGPVDRLNHYDLLESNSFLAHCVNLSDKDYEVLAELQPVIISNPESNTNNNVGKMDATKIGRYCLGTDGMTGNMIGTMRSHFLMEHADIANPQDLLFKLPQDIKSRFFTDSGGLSGGNKADIAVTNYIPVTEINLDNLFYHLMFGEKGQKMFMTIANGEIIYHNGEIKKVNERGLRKDIQYAAKKLHRRFNE